MKRDFLKGLGLEDEVIDQIMAEHGKTVNAIKGDADTLKASIGGKDTEIEGLKAQIAKRDADIEALKKSSGDVEAIRAQLGELQGKYTADTEALTKQLTDQKTAFERKSASDKFFNNVQFSSELAKRAAMSEFEKAALELKDGSYVGGKEWLEKLRKDAPDAFKAEEEKKELPRFGGSTKPNPQNDAPKDPFGFGFTPVRKMKTE